MIYEKTKTNCFSKLILMCFVCHFVNGVLMISFAVVVLEDFNIMMSLFIVSWQWNEHNLAFNYMLVVVILLPCSLIMLTRLNNITHVKISLIYNHSTSIPLSLTSIGQCTLEASSKSGLF